MLYATTRSKVATYTAQRALKEERAPDGGYYVPTSLPVNTTDQLEALYKEPPAEIVARILNGFFKTKLGRYDVEFAVGKRLFGLAHISHRILIGELWRCGDSGFDDLCHRLTNRISAEMGACQPGAWMRIACRVALTFAIFAMLRQKGAVSHTELVDVAVLAGDFEEPYAVWAARRMGLPIGTVICCCNENGGLWELFNRGQMKLGAKAVATITPDCDKPVPDGLELLIHEKLEWDDVEDYLAAKAKGGLYYLSAEEHRHFREGFAVAVVGDGRIRMAMPNVHATNGYVLCPYSALVYTGLMDYRSRPGPRRAALMLTDRDPRQNAAAVTRALAISDEELRSWCVKG